MNNMLSLCGVVLNCFLAPDFKDSKSGEVIKGRYKCQMLCDTVLKNGEQRKEMINLSYVDRQLFEGLAGHVVAVPVGAYSSGRTIGYYMTGNEVEDLGKFAGED